MIDELRRQPRVLQKKKSKKDMTFTLTNLPNLKKEFASAHYLYSSRMSPD
jgi:hypothetical protein